MIAPALVIRQTATGAIWAALCPFGCKRGFHIHGPPEGWRIRHCPYAGRDAASGRSYFVALAPDECAADLAKLWRMTPKRLFGCELPTRPADLSRWRELALLVGAETYIAQAGHEV